MSNEKAVLVRGLGNDARGDATSGGDAQGCLARGTSRYLVSSPGQLATYVGHFPWPCVRAALPWHDCALTIRSGQRGRSLRFCSALFQGWQDGEIIGLLSRYRGYRAAVCTLLAAW